MKTTVLKLLAAATFLGAPWSGIAFAAGPDTAAHADADGTFTIHLEDDNAPAGAPSGDLERRTPKPGPKGKTKASHTAAGHAGGDAAHGDADAPDDDHDAAANAHGKKADAHGKQPDAHGKKSDAHGKKADSYGKNANAHGTKADAHGKNANAHGKKADSHGKNANAHGTKADAHGKQPDPHGKNADAHGNQADAHGKQAGSHGKKADAHGKQADSHGNQADAHGKQAGSHGKKADAHGKKADAHGKQADPHGGQADSHGKDADAHGNQADAHGEQADAHGKQADAHGTAADTEDHDADAHGDKPARHDGQARDDGEDADDEASDDDGETTHELLEPAAKPKKKRRPRDWKPLSGTGFSDARRNKWGVIEAVPPAVAARARLGFRGDEIQFPDKVHFTRDSIRFAAGADEVLARIAEQLQASPEITTLWIEGHTDFDGSEAYNQKLSEARASAVREALVRLGVAPERLVAYGFGESRPVVGGRQGSNVHENRRVVFRLVQGDRPALQSRRAVEFGHAAVVGVWGTARWRSSALAEPAHGSRRVPGGALALLSAEQPAEGAADVEPNFAAEAEAAAAGTPEASPVVGQGADEADDWRALEFRTQLPEGAVIETASGARVLLRLPDLTRVLVEPDSRLALTKLFHSSRENKSYTSARLETGAIAVAANPDERGVSSSIWSFAGGALELTSAEFELRTTGDGAAIALLRGAGSASTGGARSVSLKSGERLEPGGSVATPMVPRPEIEGPLTGTVPTARLVWKAVPEATRYRFEVAEDITFLQPARVEWTEGLTYDVPGLDSGRTWYWRVRAADASGTLGQPSRIHGFRLGSVAAAPVPPAPTPAPASPH
jgi:outer membrane protein OmpA-like peptidoglycan-associated protein